ncbi:MAG TPA: tetratricopeptide repeat protein [Gemmataceae bacterium]|nr:tetratricopeptide repeat protein [Gemmataceae bacterium]
MPLSARLGAILLALLAAAAPAVRAQGPIGDRPEPFTPARPETREELNRREALKLYGVGVFHEHANRLLAAVRAYEDAVRLDPEAPAPYKALVPLYLGLDRLDDALTACKKALDLDPGDYETWHLYARQLRVHDRPKEAADALKHALDCPGLKEHPELHAQTAFDLAVVREGLGDFAWAEEAYLEVVKVLDNPAALVENDDASPDEIEARAADTLERLGRVCLRAGKHDRARDYFVKARDRVKEKDPARARRLSYNLAELYMAREEWQPALAALDEYLDTMPQGTEAYRAKIKVLQKLGRGGEVVALVKKYAERDAQNPALRLLYAEQLGAAGRFDDADRIFRDMAKETPTPDVYRGLFKLYADGRQFDRLLRLLDDDLKTASGADGADEAAARARAMLVVLREDPALVRGLMPPAQARLVPGGSLDTTTCFFLGVLAARTRQLDAAEQLFRECVRQNQFGPPRLRDKEAEVYQNLLRVLLLAHKDQAIVEVCREGLRKARATQASFFRLQMAQALARLGKWADGLKEADAALAVAPDPSRLRCRETRVRILMMAERYEQAAAECKDLLKDYTAPDEVREIHHTLSVIYSSAHEYDKAEEQLKGMLDADPNDATANNDLGYLWAEQNKNLERAEAMIRKAIELDRKQRLTGTALDADSDRDNAAYVDSLGWVLFRRGRLDEARQELQKAVALPDGADDPAVWDHLGDVCARAGDGEKARAAWARAVELYEGGGERPKDDRYKEIKQKLRK